MGIVTYPVTCACGKTYQVAGSSAGGRYTCHCGRPIEIPSLTHLKASVGLPVASPEFLLAGLAATGSLPLEQDCVLCGQSTREKATYLVVCERPVAPTYMPWWQWVLLGWFSPLRLAIEATHAWKVPAVGNDVTLRLSIRVCEECMQTLTTHRVIRDVMSRTPEYARLFEKFPAAAIHNAD